ncbi:MAG: response regulator, partial [Betaproteobacteria bacterium]
MSPAANKPTILIVAGEAMAARDLEQQLWASGFAPVGHATTVTQALVLAGALRPDLVLMDLQAPGAAVTWSATETIRAQFAVPVVFLTAPAEGEADNRAGLPEPPACLAKPFTDRELRAVLELSLYQRRMEARLELSEQRFRTIFDAEPECVKVVGLHDELLEMNVAGLAILEADSVEEVKALSLFNFILPEYHAAFRALHKDAIAGKSGLLEFEVVGLRGTRRWLETHAAPIA